MPGMKFIRPDGFQFTRPEAELAAIITITPAIRALISVIDDKILVPLVLPDEDYGAIRKALEDALSAADRVEQKLESYGRILSVVLRDLYDIGY